MTRKIATLAPVFAAAALVGCAPGADVEADAALAVVDYSFVPSAVTLLNMDGFDRLRVDGLVGGAQASLFVDLADDRAGALTGQRLGVDGATWFASADSASFEAYPEQSPVVWRAWVMGACAGCVVQDNAQAIHGEIAVTEDSAQRLSGSLDLVLEGSIPAWPSATGAPLRVIVRGPFVVEFASATTPEISDEATAEQGGTAAEVVPPQPGTGGSPMPTIQDPGPAATAISETRSVTLLVEQGLNLETGAVVAHGNFKNSDLFATAGSSWLKLSAGGPNPTVGQPLRWFSNSGGFVQTFDSVHDIPLMLPTDKDASKSIVNARPYIGFVVRGNLSDTWARVWIQSADEDHVSLVYQLVAPAE